jgi:hypothetical protein
MMKQPDSTFSRKKSAAVSTKDVIEVTLLLAIVTFWVVYGIL